MTFFSDKDSYYKPVPSDGRIVTKDFMHACRGIVDFVGCMGTVFKPVKNDLQGNIEKLATKYETDVETFHTLQQMVEFELENPNNVTKPEVARDALLWLKRGLQFNCLILESIVNDTRNGADRELLAPLVQTAYEQTLQPYHNYLTKKIVQLAVKATPYRKDLLKSLAKGQEGMEEQVLQDLKDYLPTMRSNVDCLIEFYRAKGLDK